MLLFRFASFLRPAGFFCLFLLAAGISAAQTVNLKNFTDDDGLASSKIVCLFQDSKGYLWVGTTEGLSKYDGNTFTNYKILEGLKSNFIYKIIEDTQGNIWFETYEGVTRFDGKTFKNFNERDGLPSNEIYDFQADRQGNVWIATGKGVVKFDGKQFVRFTEKEGSSDNIRSMLIDRDGRVWFGDRKKGLICYDGKKFVNVSEAAGRTEDHVTRIFEDSRNNIWIITNKRRSVSRFDGQRFSEVPFPRGYLEFYEISEDAEANIWITSNTGLFKYDGRETVNYHEAKDAEIKSIVKDRSGSLWFATSNPYVIRYDGRSFQQLGENMGLITRYENCVLEDREGNIWIGTYGFGLYKYTMGIFSFEDASLGIINERVNCMLQDRSGSLWFGTSGKGVYKVDGRQVQRFTEMHGLGSDIVNAMYEDREGNIWFGCIGGLQKKVAPLTRYDGKTFSNYFYTEGLETQYKFAIAQDKKNNYWLGTFQGLFRFSEDKDKIFEKTGRVGNDYIKAIAKDKAGNLWIGTFGGGLLRFDGYAFKDYTVKDGLSSNFINCIAHDTLGNIWVGNDKGINVLKPGAQGNIASIDAINYKNGLNNDIIVSMAFDNHQDLWIGTFGGINKLYTREYFRSGKKQIKSFGYEDGLKGIKCLDNSILKDGNGDIWFGTTKGLIKWKVDKYKTNSIEPLTQITNVRLFYEDYDYTALGATYAGNSKLPENLVLPYNKNYLTFDFISICLTNEKLVRYQHKLEGFDEDWLPVTEQRFATYSNLPPGNYQFKVMACNNDGLWNQEPATFSFTVSPPFWRTYWFTGGAVVLVIGSIFGFMYFRLQHLKKKEQAKTQLNKELAKVELKALRAQMNPHFIFNSLNSIQLYISRNDKELANRFLSRFSKLIRMTLENSGKSSISLVEELEQLKLYLELEKLRLGNKLTYEIETDPNLNIYELEIPTLLIQPFVENAIWHGIANKDTVGKVSVQLRRERDFLVCSVTDDGIGRQKSQELKNSSLEAGKSKGIQVTNERLQLLNSLNRQNATISITDLVDPEGEPCGTQVEVYISMEYLKYD